MSPRSTITIWVYGRARARLVGTFVLLGPVLPFGFEPVQTASTRKAKLARSGAG